MAITRDSVILKNYRLTALLTASTNTYLMQQYMSIYTGSPPASPETAATGTLLLNSASQIPVYTQPSGGISVLSAALNYTPTVTGTAGYARITNAGGQVTMDVDVGVASSGAGMILSTTSLTNGVPFSVSNFSIQMPFASSTVILNTVLANKIVGITVNSAANIGLGYNGTLKIYTGSAPATADLAATGTLLATFSMGTAAWSAASGGSAALVSSIGATAVATGTAGYARLISSTGTYVLQGSVGVSGADFLLDSLSIVASTTTTLVNATIVA